MSVNYRIPLQLLGQSGCRMVFGETVVYVDPYLSHSVQELEDESVVRQVPIPYAPDEVTDANWLLITHEHLDHCDPHTLPKIAASSPNAKFLGPYPVLEKLRNWGISDDRLVLAEETWISLTKDLKVKAIPAAHPEIVRNEQGQLGFVGFLIDYAGKKIYLAGDTFAREEIITSIKAEGDVHTAILPVNEHNYFKGRAGIVGNMSIREAFQLAQEIGARQVVAVHWDMFVDNSVDPEEIKLVHKKLKPPFTLLLKPEMLNLADAQVSVVIRTLNEAKHLGTLLEGIKNQKTDNLAIEVVLIDSGSTDGTLEIAEKYGCRIHHITREQFSFGRSLNWGCEVADGDILVITSGHCVPCDEDWIQKLCQPILDGKAQYTYGRQFGGDESFYSETRIFAKYFPETSQIPQEGYYCNNANSALTFDAWERYKFDEELTGLEDMELAKRLVADGGKVAYVADAGVFHHHNESWKQVKTRFEREAIALQAIKPNVHMHYSDVIRYVISSIWKDWRVAWKEGHWSSSAMDIVRYRYFQYTGSYKGNNDHRKLSNNEKETYFFPD